ncbi:hypothetical protein NMK71_04860 [Weeksellaceae bacterium KMM 9713]|uniref:Uncharacterized protein n=1 Tax=Profundicola chukchiensis TaxID=2961959 RepID=A0A9X4RUJ2_9FLAO|nr:hypothetical protein [Profundicola chukchiensis]MDG4945736.1 hypothetical protein [Profundicola chukchiensis]
MDISNSDFRIIYDKDFYYLKVDDKLLKTSSGIEIKNSNRELLEQLAYELECYDNLNIRDLSLYVLINTQLDFIESGKFNVDKTRFRNVLLNDPTLKASAGPERIHQFAKWRKLFEYLEIINFDYPDIIQAFEIEEVEDWIASKGKNYSNSINEFVDLFYREFQILNSVQKSAVLNLMNIHGSVIYSIFLATKKCSVMEYAVAILASHCIIPNVFLDVSKEEYKESLLDLKQDALLITEYINLSLTPNIQLSKLISSNIPNWNALPNYAQLALSESIKNIHLAASDDYSSYVMLLGKGVEITLKQKVFDKFHEVSSLEFYEQKEISTFLKSNDKIFPLAKFICKEPHFIEFGSMLIILEKYGGKTAKKNELLKSFFSFIIDELSLVNILDKQWIEEAKTLSRARNKAAHSDRFSLSEAKQLQEIAFTLLKAF